MEIKDVTEAKEMAMLSKPLLDIHVENHPLIFKPFDENAVVGHFEQCMARPEYIHLGVYEGDDIIGYLQAEIKQIPGSVYVYPMMHAHIHQMYVKTDYRGKGYGKMMIDEIKRRAKKLGMSRIDLAIWEMDIGSVDFYASCGFTTDQTHMYINI
ncbi:MAG: GNAT family N-acetyltransferase [Chitinophagales bacterium]|nr:GNAT family N-acetyltransferase [Chitinophagales bacterium]